MRTWDSRERSIINPSSSRTKLVRTYTFCKKREALDNFKNLLHVQLKSEGSQLLAYQWDEAKELIFRDVGDVLVEAECLMSYSPPCTAALNGTVERSHRTIFESAFAMLIGASCQFSSSATH